MQRKGETAAVQQFRERTQKRNGGITDMFWKAVFLMWLFLLISVKGRLLLITRPIGESEKNGLLIVMGRSQKDHQQRRLPSVHTRAAQTVIMWDVPGSS